MTRFFAWGAFLLGGLFFLMPLVGMTEFSLKMRRGEYSFDAYRKVFEDPQFWATFGYSLTLAGAGFLAPVGVTEAFRHGRASAGAPFGDTSPARGAARGGPRRCHGRVLSAPGDPARRPLSGVG